MQPTLKHPPARRVLRTARQVLVALVAVVPALVAVLSLAGITLDGPAIVAIVGAAVVVVTAIENGLEHAGRAPVIRTLVQVLVAVAAVVPAFVATLAAGGIHIDEAALALIAGAAVMVTTTVQNLLEHRGTIPTLAAPKPAPGSPPPCIGCDPVAPHGVNPELFDDGQVR